MKIKLTRRGKVGIVILLVLIVGIPSFLTYWWNVYLPNQARRGGFDENKPIKQFDPNDPITNNYYPRPKRPTHLYSINMSQLPNDTAVTILTLAGVIAKGDKGPQIYVEDDGGYYSKWRSLIENESINVTDVSDPWALVSMFKDNISGYILYKADDEGIQQSNDPILSSDTLLYKHKDESYLPAVSLCGVLNACAVEERDEAKAIAAGLTKVFDARGKNCSWIFNSSYWPQLRHDMVFEVEHHTNRRLFLIDYAVFCGAPVIHAQTQDQRAEYLSHFDADSPVFGWGAVGPTDEAGLNLQTTLEGQFFMPSDWARDLSVFSAINVSCEQKPLPEPKKEENVHYVTIVMSDGDNLQWLMNDFGSSKFFGNSHRGDFPMGWTIPPQMADLAPLIMRYYYHEATINDRFIAGNSGHGLIYVSRDPWQEIHINRSGPVLERADIKVVMIQDFGWQKESFEATCNLNQTTGVIYNDYRQYAMQAGKTMWVNDKPCISFTFNFWVGFDSATGIAMSVNTASRNVHDPAAYSLIVVHAWSHGLDDVYDLVNSFDSHVRVVDPETFIQLYSENVPHKDSNVFLFMHYLTLFGQYAIIVAIIGVSIVLIKKGVEKLKPKIAKKIKSLRKNNANSAMLSNEDQNGEKSSSNDVGE
ncbi:MAG: GxGYxYP domain-containing protein [Promethearchaeota archaeon]